MPTFNRSDETYSIDDAIRHNEEMERREEARAAAKGGQSEARKRRQDIRYINFVPIQKAAWNILVHRANIAGAKVGEFIGTLVDELMETGALEKIVNSDGFQIDILQLQTRQYRERLERLEMEVAEYNSHPTDELAHLLMKQCDVLGVSLDDIVKRVKDDPIKQAAYEFKSDPGTKINLCTKWMSKLMIDNSYRINSREANRLGYAEGYTRDCLRTARSGLGIRTVIGDGGEWYWEWSSSTMASRSILGVD